MGAAGCAATRGEVKRGRGRRGASRVTRRRRRQTLVAGGDHGLAMPVGGMRPYRALWVPKNYGVFTSVRQRQSPTTLQTRV